MFFQFPEYENPKKAYIHNPLLPEKQAILLWNESRIIDLNELHCPQGWKMQAAEVKKILVGMIADIDRAVADGAELLIFQDQDDDEYGCFIGGRLETDEEFEHRKEWIKRRNAAFSEFNDTAKREARLKVAERNNDVAKLYALAKKHGFKVTPP